VSEATRLALDRRHGQVRAIVRELLPMLGPHHPQLEEAVKDLCAQRIGLDGYNTASVRRAIEAVTRVPRP